MKHTKFEADDIIGRDTLSVINKANHFNRWMYQTIKPFCKGKVLEIGSGLGNISSYFLQDNFPIFLSDIRQNYCEHLKQKFSGAPSLLGVEVLDLVNPSFEAKSTPFTKTFDTVFALNVIEHIKDDTKALSNCFKLLKPGGHLIVLVPSYNALYNGFDEGLGHYRRYNKHLLSELFRTNHFKIIHKQYFNFMGIFGWYVSGTLLKKETIPEGQMKLYNLLVPCFKLIDKLIFNGLGLSTIVVGKK